MNRRGRVSSATTSFEAFVAGATEGLLRTAYLITWNLPEAEDAVQEALSRAALRWDRVEKMEHPRAYVRRIAVNCATAQARTREPRLVRGHDDAADVFADLSDERFEQQLSRIDTRSEVLWLLSRLSRQQRAVLVLRYFEDLSEAQIAAQLSLPLGTVKSTTSRALEHLRRSLVIEPLTSSASPLPSSPLPKGTLT